MNSLLLSISFLCLCAACQSPAQYGHLIGEWEIVKIEVSGERIALEEALDSRQFLFTSRGTFQQGFQRSGDLSTAVGGTWKITGKRLQLIQPEIKDLNGRVVSKPLHHEWELTVSPEWMIWRGTGQSQTQNIKITLHKPSLPKPREQQLSAQ